MTENRPPTSPRPAVAIINNSQTPYRLALHRRIAREMPEIKLFSVFTHEGGSAAWKLEDAPEIGPVMFGKGESSADQSAPRHALREWKKGGRIIRWMREQNVRAVVIGGYNDAGRLRVIRWCRKHQVPCFLFADSNVRGDKVCGVKRKMKQLIVGRVVRACSGILPCGELGKEYFARYGAREDRMFYFPYEPDYALIEAIAQEIIDETARAFKLSAGRHRLIYSGRLVSFKRVDLLIDAFVAIADRRPDWDLIIAGDGPEMASLKARVQEGFSRIAWTGFIDDQAKLSALYHSCDVLVLPSDYEPWAVVINEAAAAGLAIVSNTVVGAAHELVRDGVNGRIVAPDDLGALEAALIDVTDAAKTDRMKSASIGVLADWRRRGDPVEGLRAALKVSCVL